MGLGFPQTWSEKVEEFFYCEPGIFDDRAEQRPLDVFRMVGDGDENLGPIRMFEVAVASSASPTHHDKFASLKCPYDLARRQRRQAATHAVLG